jgi:Fe-S-cluster-containing hydrogenase component 2
METGRKPVDAEVETRAEPTTAARRRPRLPAIDAQRCTGCGRCVGACAPQLLSLAVVRWKKRAVLAGAERCTGCSLCALRCPFDAIQMRRQPD